MAAHFCDNTVLNESYQLINDYLINHYTQKEIQIILNEVNHLFPFPINETCNKPETNFNYNELQNILSTINEKKESRKKNGVYYTENDITTFILESCFKLYLNKPINTAINSKLNAQEKEQLLPLSIFDPTCGSGAFLLTALEYKSKIIATKESIEKKAIKNILKSIYGNDIELESIIITKLRLFLSILNIFGIKYINNIAEILNKNFTCLNIFDLSTTKKYDFVIGNPPYVEDNIIDIPLQERFGNIYASVLNKSLALLKENSCYGFIIPISYISTPRMSKIRNILKNKLTTELIFSYADRPGCLFTAVHQKLNIVIGSSSRNEGLFTGNYQYWYKDERTKLFNDVQYIRNNSNQELFIPKLGNQNELNIYDKICNFDNSLKSMFSDEKTDNSLYLNMRACFWIKAFLNNHTTGEYKELYFNNNNLRNYIYCILNSSLFWWFWISISDCWHITNKEFETFKLPCNYDNNLVNQLALNLENKLEETKKYIGSKQTDYEYKHKLCVNEIHAIDDYINRLFDLTDEESDYIKNYALVYRTSEGVKNECN